MQCNSPLSNEQIWKSEIFVYCGIEDKKDKGYIKK